MLMKKRKKYIDIVRCRTFITDNKRFLSLTDRGKGSDSGDGVRNRSTITTTTGPSLHRAREKERKKTLKSLYVSP